ncbi:SpoIIE family protein phosphatase [Egibacter rhizosphaerae]|uniref:SpoIIE family protein phosphatase n=1 Tax=Egibacter rhizosphaerae TaxID=1670831 RepID=UPI0013F15D09|nr:SpoIIE family protein phosphatase [Egibacter rhizosphaerae]
MTDLSDSAEQTSELAVLRPVLDGLPVPAIVVEASSGQHGVLHANPEFSRVFGLDGWPADATLREMLPPERTTVLDGPPLEEVLETITRTGETVTTRVQHDVPPGAAGALRTRWTVHLQPLGTGDTAWGILGVLVDRSGQLFAGARASESTALQDLAAGLTATKPVEQVYEDAVRGAVLAAGGQRGAILLSEGGASFRVAAATPDGVLNGPITVEELASPLWQACLGRRRIAWSVDDETADGPGDAVDTTPLPFAGEPGWEQLLIVGLRLHGRWQGVIVVGEPRMATFDAEALERLELVATLSSTAVDNARLVDQFQRLEEMLTAAVMTSAALVECTEPQDVQRRLLDGLVGDMGLAGAALWVPGSDGEPGLQLAASAGLPSEVHELIAHLPDSSMAGKLAHGAVSGRLRQAATAAATSSWPGHEVRLVHVPEPAPGILGVYVDRPVPDLVDGVLATLAHALAAAVHQATLHERARTVVDSLQRELRPRGVVLPQQVDVGHVYRSATAGVDVGGDFIDWFVTERDEIGVACGDVSGKGVEAASLTAMAVYSLRAFGMRGTSAAMLLQLLNGSVVDQTPPERFMTLAYAKFDPATWEFQLALAGQPPPAVVSAGGARLVDAPPDPPVGIDTDTSFDQTELQLGPGEALVLYTDGVTEARGADGALFGSARLIETLSGLASGDAWTAQQVADGVWAAIQEWTDGGTTDDCALVVLRRCE